MGVAPRHHARPGRITNRGLAVSIFEKGSHLRQSIDIGSPGLRVPIKTANPIVQIINRDK